MSINFNHPVGPEEENMLKKMFGEPVASDRKTFLYDDMESRFRQQLMQGRKMTELANKAKQPVAVELNKEGEIKTLSDGTQYRVTPKGWRKVGT